MIANMNKKNESNKNVTFTLPVYLIEKYREYAAEKHIPSISAGVREALVKYSYKIEEEILHKKMKEAAKDPLFIKDLEECMNDFEIIDNELNKGDDEW